VSAGTALPRVGFSGFNPSSRSQNGPVVSLNRLARSMQEQGLVQARPASAWRNDLNVYVVQAPRITLKPFVLRVDGIAFDSANTLGDTDRLNAPTFRSIRASRGLMYVSDFSRQLVEHFDAVPEQPYVVLHNSVDLGCFSPDGEDHRAELGWGKEDLVLVSSAKWRRWKRLPETLELFRRWKERYARPCRLLIMGGGEHVATEDPDVHYTGGFPGVLVPHRKPLCAPGHAGGLRKHPDRGHGLRPAGALLSQRRDSRNGGEGLWWSGLRL
jgi:glycosyltransferase involved in cell wall biosynthesis